LLNGEKQADIVWKYTTLKQMIITIRRDVLQRVLMTKIGRIFLFIEPGRDAEHDYE